MNTYVVLVNYTEEGIKTIKDSPARADKVRQMLEDAGGGVKHLYLTMGEYDFVIVFEAPDDETMAKVLLETGRLGTVRTKTMRAFPKEVYESLVASL